MKNTYKSLFLGIGTALATGASFALITPIPANTVINQAKSDTDNNAINLANANIASNDNPTILASNQRIEAQQPDRDKTIFYKVKQGDSISTIFNDLSLNTGDLHKILHNRKLGKQFTNLDVGKSLSIKVNSKNELLELSYKKDDTETFVAARKDSDFVIKIHSKPLETRYATAHVVIRSSLSKAGKNAGLPGNLTKRLADIFAWDIDFAQNLRQNDQFTVVYEEMVIGDKVVDTGDIVAAEFVNQGKAHQAVRYKDKDGDINYYTPKGEGMRKAFLSNPLDFAKISSPFSLHRNHPILNRIRAHTGVDYAASTGTPVKSTGDGKIVYQGTKGGYGQLVMVDHGHGYTTVYAHLSNFQKNLQSGDSVKQGQVIGYVGQTGLATGPHLHYEFLVDGVHKDPMTAKVTNAMPINKALQAHFKSQTKPLLAQLEQAKTTMLAKNGDQD